MMAKKNISLLLYFFFVLSGLSLGQVTDKKDDYYYKNLTPEQSLKVFGPIKGSRLNKVVGDKREIKDITIKGNKITSILYNYGSVCAPSVLSNVEDLVWNGLGYGFEF